MSEIDGYDAATNAARIGREARDDALRTQNLPARPAAPEPVRKAGAEQASANALANIARPNTKPAIPRRRPDALETHRGPMAQKDPYEKITSIGHIVLVEGDGTAKNPGCVAYLFADPDMPGQVSMTINPHPGPGANLGPLTVAAFHTGRSVSGQEMARSLAEVAVMQAEEQSSRFTPASHEQIIDAMNTMPGVEVTRPVNREKDISGLNVRSSGAKPTPPVKRVQGKAHGRYSKDPVRKELTMRESATILSDKAKDIADQGIYAGKLGAHALKEVASSSAAAVREEVKATEGTDIKAISKDVEAERAQRVRAEYNAKSRSREKGIDGPSIA